MNNPPNILTPQSDNVSSVQTAPESLANQRVQLTGAIKGGRQATSLTRSVGVTPQGELKIRVNNLITTISDGSLTVAMLGAALASHFLDSVTLSKDTEGTVGANTIRVTMQLLDIAGTNWTKATLVEIWLADTATGWETGSAPDTSATVGVGSGVAADIPTVKKRFRGVTTTGGAITLDVVHGGSGGNWYVRIKAADVVYTSSTTLAFA